MDKNDLTNWTDERLAKLSPAPEWRPDAEKALVRFHERRAGSSAFRQGTASAVPNDISNSGVLTPEVGRRVWLWGASAAAAACACLLAFPTSRDLVQRVWPGAPGQRMVYVGQVSADLKTLKDEQAAPDFVLKDAAGKNVRLSDYKGKVVLLNFWATYCGGCKTEIPWLVAFQKEYETRGLAVIGVSMDDEGWKVVTPFIRQAAVNYTILLGDGDITEQYGLTAMPMTVLIDRDGKVSAASVGLIDKDECETEILRLLGK